MSGVGVSKCVILLSASDPVNAAGDDVIGQPQNSKSGVFGISD